MQSTCFEPPIQPIDSYMNSSFGWDPEAKNRELYHSLSRFILVYDIETNDIIAFTMYRFEVEEEDNVIYWCAYLKIERFINSFETVMTSKLDPLSKG